MRLSPSTRRTLATIAAFLMLLVGLLLAASKVDDDSSGDPNPAPSSSPSAPASTAPADPSPSTPLTSEPTTSEPIPSPTDTAYNITAHAAPRMAFRRPGRGRYGGRLKQHETTSVRVRRPTMAEVMPVARALVTASAEDDTEDRPADRGRVAPRWRHPRGPDTREPAPRPCTCGHPRGGVPGHVAHDVRRAGRGEAEHDRRAAESRRALRPVEGSPGKANQLHNVPCGVAVDELEGGRQTGPLTQIGPLVVLLHVLPLGWLSDASPDHRQQSQLLSATH